MEKLLNKIKSLNINSNEKLYDYMEPSLMNLNNGIIDLKQIPLLTITACSCGCGKINLICNEDVMTNQNITIVLDYLSKIKKEQISKLN